MKDNNVFKFMFKLSFVPIGLLLLAAVSCTFTGFTFFGCTDYGWDAFCSMMTIGFILCCVPVPILPICLIYQIIYLVKTRKSAESASTEAEGEEQKCAEADGSEQKLAEADGAARKHAERKREKNPPLFLATPLCVGAVAVVLFVVGAMVIGEDASYRIDEARMVRRAEQIIDLEEKESNPYAFNHDRDHKLYVDYNTPSLGFCHYYFERVKLLSDTEQAMRHEIEGSCLLQAMIPLESPGKMLYAYSGNKYDLSYSTTAFVMVMEDGSVYSCDEKHMDHVSAKLGRTIYSVLEE